MTKNSTNGQTINKMAFTKEKETEEILKSKKTPHNRKPRISPDPVKIQEMENLKDSIMTLYASTNTIKQHLKDYYLQELSNLTPHINAQNRKAANSNGVSQWVIVTKSIRSSRDLNTWQAKEGNKMPGNSVKINDGKSLNWYVGDSEMDKLIEYLDKHGIRGKG